MDNDCEWCNGKGSLILEDGRKIDCDRCTEKPEPEPDIKEGMKTILSKGLEWLESLAGEDEEYE